MGAATSRPAESAVPTRLTRFDRVERAVHWANAVLFGVLLFTGATLYVGPLSAIVGRRALVKEIHVFAGLCLPVPLLLGLGGPWRRGLRHDLRALNRWDADDRRWLRTWGDARHDIPLGKFNPGQKLNAAFVGGAILLMLATGSIMRWFGPFPDAWRTGATFVHDWLFIAIAVTVAGHIWLAVSDAATLRGMVRGWVPVAWARRVSPKWYEAQTGRPATGVSSTSTAPTTPTTSAPPDGSVAARPG